MISEVYCVKNQETRVVLTVEDGIVWFLNGMKFGCWWCKFRDDGMRSELGMQLLTPRK